MNTDGIIALLITGIVISKIIIGILVYILVKRNKQLKDDKKLLASQNRELKLAADFKLKILSIATHDLRSPFTTLRMFSDNISLLNTTPDILENILLEFDQQVKVAHKTVDDILLWAAGEMNHPTYSSSETFNVANAVKQVIDLFKTPFRYKNISVQCHIENGVNGHGSSEVFNIIVRNIVHNAIKHSPSDGKISIDMSVDDNGRGQLSIVDEGAGMSEDKLSAINSGQSFMCSSNKDDGSLGLGLSLSYMLARRSEWKIVADKLPHVGSRFSLYFPTHIRRQKSPIFSEVDVINFKI